jgi:hypothetical protein
VDDISLSGAVNIERLEDLTNLLEEALGAGFSADDDPELSRILEEMERASMPAMPTISNESASSEGGEQEPPLSA